MACVTPRGELTPSGRGILEVLLRPVDVDGIARATGLPVFRARAALREFLEAGLAAEDAGRYAATPLGLERLKPQA